MRNLSPGNPQWTFVIKASSAITDVLEVFYLPTETRVNAAKFLRQSLHQSLRRTVKIAGAEAVKYEDFPQQPSSRSKEMDDVFNLVMLICAAIGSMAFGVLVAYGIFRVGFAMMRPRRAMAPVKVRTQLASE